MFIMVCKAPMMDTAISRIQLFLSEYHYSARDNDTLTSKLLKDETNIVQSELADSTDTNIAQSELADSKDAREKFWLWDKYDAPAIGDNAPASGDRYLIYRCDETGPLSLCGGWNNRISGALFAYVIANVTGRKFRFEHRKPECDVTKYVVPNKVDWYLENSFHKTLSNSETVGIKFVVDYRRPIDEAVVTNYSNILGEKNQNKPFVYFTGNLFYELGYRCSHVHSNELMWMKNLTAGEIRAALFKRMFKLSGYLRQRLTNIITKNLPTKKHRLICVHMRMGRNPSNPHDSEVRQDAKGVEKVWEFLKNISTNSYDKVFVASDDARVIQAARNQSFAERLVTVDGPTLHIDRWGRHVTKDEKCAGLEKLILEEHLLMTCDVLMVSHSGIGHLAAHIRATDQGLFCWYKGARDVEPCRRRDLMTNYFDYVYKDWNNVNCADLYHQARKRIQKN